MSRKSRELRLHAEERWPTLQQFLAAYCHQDLGIFHGSLADAIDAAIADYPLATRQTVLREWRDWMNSVGCGFDPRSALNAGLGVEVFFNDPAEAREFMSMVYDKLITSVRRETKNMWKPEWQR